MTGSLNAGTPTVISSIFSVGWPTPTGTDWPSLPQVPTPLSSAVVAHHGHAIHHLRTVADQRRTLDRRSDPAVFDQIGLTGGRRTCRW